MNYSKGKPMGNNGIPHFDSPPAFKALAVNGITNATTSSVITLTQDTTAIEVATQGVGGAVIKWITTGDTSGSVFSISSVGATNPPNFDHEIPAATVRRFVVPIETFVQQNSSVQGVNRAQGLYQRVAIAGAGISSVMVTEY